MSTVADQLIALGAAAVLAVAAERGLISELSCAMPECKCPEGREHFKERRQYNPWAPSADRWTVPGREGGKYLPTNVRLAHFQCNRAEGGKYGGKYVRSAATRALISAAVTARQTGTKHSAATKSKMSASAKEAHERNPRPVKPPKPKNSKYQTKAKMSESARAHRSTPEGKAQLSAAVSASKTPEAKAKRLATWARKRAEATEC